MPTLNPNTTPNLIKAKALWATQVCTLAKNNLTRAHKIATGTLFNSITYTIDIQTGAVNFLYEDYGENVESGRRRGARLPPIQAISQWARVKGLSQGRTKKGRFASNESRAWAIATAIQRDGIPAYPFFQKAINQAIDQLYPELENAIVADLENNLDQSTK